MALGAPESGRVLGAVRRRLLGPYEELDRRMADLEHAVREIREDVDELRQHGLRLAELTDVIQELLIPMASRDQDRVDEAIERFSRSV